MILRRAGCSFAPFGMAASDPPMPTGTIGTPVRDGHVGGAVEQLAATTGPVWRVPSGNITSGSPPLDRSSMQARSASRSARAAVHREGAERRRRTGPSGFDFQSESLPM